MKVFVTQPWPEIYVNAVSPGYTQTRLNGFAGTDTVEEGAARPCALRCSVLKGRQARSLTRPWALFRGDLNSLWLRRIA